MIALIAMGCASFLATLMVICTCAGKPLQDELNEIQAEDAK